MPVWRTGNPRRIRVWRRVDLAAAFRLAARLGLHEGICNHFSIAVQGSHDLLDRNEPDDAQ
jgi:ribulose-5-phosphate 4-epimerase/fuculose-1-phosphate aldolase